jgi:hypothetical protein
MSCGGGPFNHCFNCTACRDCNLGLQESAAGRWQSPWKISSSSEEGKNAEYKAGRIYSSRGLQRILLGISLTLISCQFSSRHVGRVGTMFSSQSVYALELATGSLLIAEIGGIYIDVRYFLSRNDRRQVCR